MNRQMLKIVLIGFVLAGMTIAGPAVQVVSAATFESGTTCTSATDPGGHDKCLGSFNPGVNTVVTLPEDGILDYATFTVPAGITVSFTRNAANTPVIIRTYGNVSISGTVSVSAPSAGKNAGTNGDGNLGDDGQPGIGGPGGFNGGYGGYSALFGGAIGRSGGGGTGPGGGQPASGYYSNYGLGGGGGSFSTAGSAGAWPVYAAAGSTYGQASILPLVGGSGGGGGSAGESFSGAGGGGGGGAILIAAGTASSPATITLTTSGRIYADGSAGGNSGGTGCGGDGGGGSGGAIRLVAETQVMTGSPYLQAIAGAGGSGCSGGGAGGAGYIRLEATTLTGWNTGRSNPAYTFALPGHAMVPNNPTLTIASVAPAAGSPVSVPASPTGNADITFPEGTTSATVNIAATNIPIGTTVRVYVVPSTGAARSSALSSALTGASEAATTATASVTLSPGNNVLLASATYSVTELIAMNLPTFDNGVRVARIRVDSTMGGETRVTYITATGKEYPAEAIKKKG